MNVSALLADRHIAGAMKLLLLLVLVGLASASFNGGNNYKGKPEMDDELRQEIGNKLNGVLEKLLNKIQKLHSKGINIKDKMLDKLEELREKLKGLGVQVDDKVKELVRSFKETSPELYERIQQRMKIDDDEDVTTEEVTTDVDSNEEAALARADINIKNVFKQFQKLLKEVIDKEKLKEQVEKLFGKGTEMAEQIINTLKEKGEAGKQKLLEMVDRILGDGTEQSSIADVYEKVRDFFKMFNLELKQKHFNFGEWVRTNLNNVLDGSKSRIENLREIAREFLNRAKEVRKDVAEEGLHFFRLYKEDLGSLWEELKKAAKEIANRAD